MSLTNHGHHIPGSPIDDEPDLMTISRARCGGPGICSQCSRESFLPSEHPESPIVPSPQFHKEFPAVGNTKHDEQDIQESAVAPITIEDFDDSEEVDDDDDHNMVIQHARRELMIIGEEPKTIEWYIRVIKEFLTFGHSGYSAMITAHTLYQLLQLKNLAGLTNDPAEWMHIADDVAGVPNLWQSRRNSEAFSHDGGTSYTLLSERDTGQPLHISAKKDEVRPTDE